MSICCALTGFLSIHPDLNVTIFTVSIERVRLVAPYYSLVEKLVISLVKLDSYRLDNSNGESYSFFVLDDPES